MPLALTRRAKERIRIRIGGAELWVTVVRFMSGDQVRLSFDGSDQFEILREEVIERREGP